MLSVAVRMDFMFSPFDSAWTPRLKYSRKLKDFDVRFRISILFGHALRTGPNKQNKSRFVSFVAAQETLEL